MSLFNAHYDERCFLPIHIYDAQTGRPIAIILRPGKTPTGEEIRGHLRRLVRRIRQRWPATRILIRGDSHYGRAEVMQWCEDNGIDYVFGLPGNRVLDRLVDESADDIRTRRALEQKPVLRGYVETRYKAKSWNGERRACARIEATTMGLDIRFVVTNLGWLNMRNYVPPPSRRRSRAHDSGLGPLGCRQCANLHRGVANKTGISNRHSSSLKGDSSS